MQQEIQVRNQIQLIFGDANMKVSIYLVYTLIGLYKFDCVIFFFSVSTVLLCITVSDTAINKSINLNKTNDKCISQLLRSKYSDFKMSLGCDKNPAC